MAGANVLEITGRDIKASEGELARSRTHTMSRKKNDSDSHGCAEARQFWEEREKLNEIVLEQGGLTIKRFFNLDTQAYADGALPARTKELLGLVASLVLRCDDCILYHLIRCHEEKVTDQELAETISIGMVVGGSITIPHVRRAFKAWRELRT